MSSLPGAVVAALLLMATFSSIGQASAHEPIAPRYHPAVLGAASQVAEASSEPEYDEQIGATFVQNLASLAFNVTALAQTGTDGYGPAYILNGVTPAGYWYQVGVSYRWPTSEGAESGFAFNYQVYGPNGRPVYPSEGSGLGGFSKTVDSGDTVLLSLTFVGASVEMSAEDLETGGAAQTSYSAVGSSTFVGDTTGPANSAGYFTGIMTEWYHVGQYTGSEGKVTYTDDSVTLSGAWLWADEFDSATPSSPPLFDNATKDPVIFEGSNVYPFESNGATIYGSAHQFITGLLNSAISALTLKPATTGTGAATFEATYTLAGLQQTSDVIAGTTTVIEADPGTSIKVATNSTADQGLETWVFSGTSGSSVTVLAGDNATYVYYELVSQQVSSAVAGNGAPLPSSPVLTYETPASTPGSSYEVVEATQSLSSAPAIVMVLAGTTASVQGNITGSVSGERWATTSASWTVSSPNVLPNPVQYYQQYQATIEYEIAGGGTPPEVPRFTSTAFGTPTTVPVSGLTPVSSGPAIEGAAQGWFDAGSSFSITGVLNGSSSSERWLGAQVANAGGSAPSALAPGVVLIWTYTHQYYEDFGVNDPSGGSVSPASGWFEAGSMVNASVSVEPQWKFEYWSGSGTGTYNATSPSLELTAAGPFEENATFYAQLVITAGAGDNVAYSYGSHTGSVSSGATDDLYVAPGTNVTLHATPSSFLYSFASWRGPSGTSVKPSLALVVGSPSAVKASSSYDYQALLGIAIVAAAVIVGVSLLIRSRRRRSRLYGPWP